jgi:hypothetical protein
MVARAWRWVAVAVLVASLGAATAVAAVQSPPALQGESADTWTETYGPGPERGTFLDGVAAAGDGYLLVGWFGPADRDDPSPWAVRVDGSGAIEWVWSLQGYGSGRLTSAVPLEDGGFIVAGVERRPETDRQRFLARLTPNGSVAWQETAGPGGVSDAVDAHDGGALLVGDDRVRVVAPDGTERWSATYDADLLAAAPLGDGYVLAGSADGDGVLLRVDGSGETVWRRVAFGEPPAAFVDVAVDDGAVYAAGDGRTDRATAASDGPVVVAGHGSNGSQNWRRTVGERRAVGSARGVTATGSGALVAAATDDSRYLARADVDGLRVVGGALDLDPRSITAADDGRYLVAGERDGEGGAQVVAPRFDATLAGSPPGNAGTEGDDGSGGSIGGDGTPEASREDDGGLVPSFSVGGVPAGVTQALLVAAVGTSLVAIVLTAVAFRRL